MNEKALQNLIDYIYDKYENLETKNIGNKENIRRYTKPIMAGYVENAVALFINDVLKDKKLNYLIDSQLSIGKRQPLRPDIIIYDENNEIHAIIEVKSQLGYSGGFDKNKYNEKIEDLKKASDECILSLKREDINFRISKKCIDFVVILMSSNSHNNLEKYNGINYFILFKNDDMDVWYDKLSFDCVNHDKKGVEAFVDYIKTL